MAVQSGDRAWAKVGPGYLEFLRSVAGGSSTPPAVRPLMQAITDGAAEDSQVSGGQASGDEADDDAAAE